jgi:hypothetical protein
VTAGRDTVGKLAEGVLNRLDIPVKVQMVRLNVGDDCRPRRKLQEGGIEFIGFGDQKPSVAQAGAGAKVKHFTADQHSGIQTRPREQ